MRLAIWLIRPLVDFRSQWTWTWHEYGAHGRWRCWREEAWRDRCITRLRGWNVWWMGWKRTRGEGRWQFWSSWVLFPMKSELLECSSSLIILQDLSASLHLRQRATAKDVWGMCPKLGTSVTSWYVVTTKWQTGFTQASESQNIVAKADNIHRSRCIYISAKCRKGLRSSRRRKSKQSDRWFCSQQTECRSWR